MKTGAARDHLVHAPRLNLSANTMTRHAPRGLLAGSYPTAIPPSTTNTCPVT